MAKRKSIIDALGIKDRRNLVHIATTNELRDRVAATLDATSNFYGSDPACDRLREGLAKWLDGKSSLSHSAITGMVEHLERHGKEALTRTLASYVTLDDGLLSREEFLRMVADRITSDLEANCHSNGEAS